MGVAADGYVSRPLAFGDEHRNVIYPGARRQNAVKSLVFDPENGPEPPLMGASGRAWRQAPNVLTPPHLVAKRPDPPRVIACLVNVLSSHPTRRASLCPHCLTVTTGLPFGHSVRRAPRARQACIYTHSVGDVRHYRLLAPFGYHIITF